MVTHRPAGAIRPHATSRTVNVEKGMRKVGETAVEIGVERPRRTQMISGVGKPRQEICGPLKWICFIVNFFIFLGSVGCLALGVYLFMTDLRPIGEPVDVFLNPAVLLTSAGFVSGTVALLGLFGALRDNVCLLKLFALFVFLSYLVLVVFTCFLFLLFYSDATGDEKGKNGLNEPTVSHQSHQPMQEFPPNSSSSTPSGATTPTAMSPISSITCRNNLNVAEALPFEIGISASSSNATPPIRTLNVAVYHSPAVAVLSPEVPTAVRIRLPLPSDPSNVGRTHRKSANNNSTRTFMSPAVFSHFELCSTTTHFTSDWELCRSFCQCVWPYSSPNVWPVKLTISDFCFKEKSDELRERNEGNRGFASRSSSNSSRIRGRENQCHPNHNWPTVMAIS